MDLSFLDDADERRKAYGKMRTAAYSTGNAEVIDLYEDMMAKGKSGRYAKARELLNHWVIDPTFGTATAAYNVRLEHDEEVIHG